MSRFLFIFLFFIAPAVAGADVKPLKPALPSSIQLELERIAKRYALPSITPAEVTVYGSQEDKGFNASGIAVDGLVIHKPSAAGVPMDVRMKSFKPRIMAVPVDAKTVRGVPLEEGSVAIIEYNGRWGIGIVGDRGAKPEGIDMYRQIKSDLGMPYTSMKDVKLYVVRSYKINQEKMNVRDTYNSIFVAIDCVYGGGAYRKGLAEMKKRYNEAMPKDSKNAEWYKDASFIIGSYEYMLKESSKGANAEKIKQEKSGNSTLLKVCTDIRKAMNGAAKKKTAPSK